VAFIVAAAVFTVPPIGPALEPVTPGWPLDRRVANEFARIAVVFVTVLLGSPMKQHLRSLAAPRGFWTLDSKARVE
jgi:hypothetical protein